jgi:hypothetical protein
MVGHEMQRAPRKAPAITSGWFRIHASSDDIQHIATVAQGHAAEQCEVAEDDRVSRDVTSHCEVFEDLRHGPNSVTGGAEQGVQRLVVLTNREGRSSALLVKAIYSFMREYR